MTNFVDYPTTGNAAVTRARATAMSGGTLSPMPTLVPSWGVVSTPDAGGHAASRLSTIVRDEYIAAAVTKQGAPPRGNPPR